MASNPTSKPSKRKTTTNFFKLEPKKLCPLSHGEDQGGDGDGSLPNTDTGDGNSAFDNTVNISVNPAPGANEAVVPATDHPDPRPVPGVSSFHENTGSPRDEVGTNNSGTSSFSVREIVSNSVPVLSANHGADIGHYIGKRPDDAMIKQLFQNHWTRPRTYNFPYSIHRKQGKDERRYVGFQHLEKYEWVVLSDKDRGLYCKYCPLFTTGFVAGHTRSTPLRYLVTEPLKKFAELTGKDGALEAHSHLQYHVEAVEAANDFLCSCDDPGANVLNQVDSFRLRQIKENRDRLAIAFQNVVWLGRQSLPLRAHREGLQKSANEEAGAGSSQNEGNFMELLKFRRLCGDQIVEKHLSTASPRNMLTSPIVQNDLIECCGQDILSQILDRVRESRFYNIIFDETTDISHVSQLSLSLRYVHLEKGRVIGTREDFLGFVDPREKLSIGEGETEDDETEQAELDQDANEDDDSSTTSTDAEEDEEEALTGVKLGGVVVDTMKRVNLDSKFCVGIGTDGCSVNNSETMGAIQEIQKTAVNAVRSSCLNHSLNLSISKSSTVSSVRKATALLKETGSFFTSSKKHRRLKKKIKRSLPQLCETRWVERHDSVLVFLEKFSKKIEVLESISEWKDAKTVAKASSLKSALLESDFLITLVCLRDLLSTTVSLSRLLQSAKIELQKASDAVLDTLSVLEEKRQQAKGVFSVLSNEVNELASGLNVPINKSRAARRGCGKEDPEPQEVEDHFRQSVYIPILDSVVVDMKNRFPKEVLDCYALSCLLPTEILLSGEKSNISATAPKLDTLVQKYSSLFGKTESEMKTTLASELVLWSAKWRRTNAPGNANIPSSVLETLDHCSKELYPTTRDLLLIMATLPSNVATAERSFSTLRRIKTWIRSTMGQDRLNGLAIMGIHRDMPIRKGNVLNNFAVKNSRRKNRFTL